MSYDSRTQRPRWVLIVADDERLRETLNRGLTRHHFEVMTVSTSSELEVLAPSAEGTQIDLVLVDVPAGPEARALAALKRIQERGYNLRTMCLVAPRDNNAFANWKIAGTLMKPIDLAELASELGRVAREWTAPAEIKAG